MESQEQTKPKRLKIAIIILAVLLVLSTGGLAARYIYLAYFAPTQATVTVPDNLIGESSEPEENTDNSSQGETTAPADKPGANDTSSSSGNFQTDKPAAKVLELYQGQPSDNQRFEVGNMFPGDTETKYFCLKVNHNKDIDLFFRADITEQTKNFGDVLHIKVTHLESGKELFDGAFSEINGREFSELLKANEEKSTIAYYQVDVSLDTSVGNEYQAARLTADFKWYVKDEGGLTPPQTGDTTNLTLWIILAGSSFLLMLLLLVRRRKEGEQHE